MATGPSDTASASQRATQVRISLKSRSDDIQLPEETGPILVSTELRRYQLSTLVNRLLETKRTVPLEFLINGQFLRSSLDEFLTQNGISAETTLSVEYVKALIPPQHVASFSHNDWISSVDILSETSKAASVAQKGGSIPCRILSGSYDGLLRVWTMSAEVVATGQGHEASIKSAKFVSPDQIVSSGVDRTLRLWRYDASDVGQGRLTPSLILYGHEASVENIAIHQSSSHLLSASADCKVGLWATVRSEAPAASNNLLPTANKKRKFSSTSASASQRGPLSLLEGHQQQVGDVCFDEKDPTVAYSASWDHAVKTWDLTTSKCVDTRSTAQSLYTICQLSEHSLLATGGALRYISLVDPRASATTVSAMTLRGHTNFVTSLARNPSSDHQFVSASNDGTCRIWDIRSARSSATQRLGESVYVIDSNKRRPEQGDENSIFSVEWNKDVGIVYGGRDSELQIYRE